MRYISEDNKVFETEQECLNHEAKIKEEQKRRNKLLEEKQKRIDDIDDVVVKLQKMCDSFREDYNEFPPIIKKLNGANSIMHLIPFLSWR